MCLADIPLDLLRLADAGNAFAAGAPRDTPAFDRGGVVVSASAVPPRDPATSARSSSAALPHDGA
jgi:hypothetical protein